MAKFFIKRPVFAMVISIMLTLIGLISAYNLPVAQYPQISPPTISVSSMYVGANAGVVNETVAQVIEQKVNGTEGMDYMTSYTDDAGNYKLSVVFSLDTVADMDTVKTQNNVNIANPSLPADVQSYGVTTTKSSDDMVLVGSIVSPDGTYDRQFMKNYMDIYFMDELKRVKGVGNINVFAADYAMRIWLNPDKLAELGMTMPEVIAAVNEQNVQAPAGTVGMMPADEGQEKQITGKVQGRLVTPEEFGNIIVRANSNGSFVHLRDIARIETGARSNSITASDSMDDAVGFGIMMTNDGNATDVSKACQEILAKAAKDFPPGMEYRQVVDITEFITNSINEVIHTFIEALLLVMIIVFVFLQSWRATLIPMLAVPVSLLATFGAFQILGFTINTLTLFAMVLAIGLVVDDAIVVIENVEHHMEVDGLGPREATEVAMDEVQGPVVAIAFVLAAVFVPVAFLGGMMGVLYRQFALTIAVSMALSAFVALSLTPALCSLILKKKDPQASAGFGTKFFSKFNCWFENLTNSYTGKVAFMIKHAKLALACLAVIVALTGLLFKLVPTTFVPEEDQGYYIISINLPEGSSLNRTIESVNKMQSWLLQQPDVRGTMGVTGWDVLTNASKSNAGTVFVSLEDWTMRKRAEQSVNSYIGRTFGIAAQNFDEATVIAINPPSLPGLGMVGGFKLELQDMSGHTDNELNEIANKIIAEANQRKELSSVYTTLRINSPHIDYDIDREKVKNLGVALSDVFMALQVNFGGYEVNDFNRFGRTYKVVMQSDKDYRDVAEASRFVFVKNNKGDMVPLNTLIIPKMNTGASIITRFNGARSITIQGNCGDGYSSGQAMAVIEEIVHKHANNGFTISWSGQSREEQKAGNKTNQVLCLALVFVFLCLAALYESWAIPFAVLMTVPTGVMGALLAEYIFNQQNSIYMQIGIIMIIGLAAKNAILIIEFAKTNKENGMDVFDAAVTGARLRLRPIIMTSLAFIIGCIPLAIASGAGAGARNNMGIAVVGGMTLATCIGIFLIPACYVVIDKLADYVKSLGSKKTKE